MKFDYDLFIKIFIDPFNTIGSRDHYGTLGSTYSDPFASYGITFNNSQLNE